MNEEILTVSDLNYYIKDVINAGFPQNLWICGEIQGYNRNRDKRHVFFELVEKDPESKNVKARIGLVIFGNRKAHIEEVLDDSENAFSLKDDIEVKFQCNVDFYPPHGVVRLIVEDIDPTYTLGKLAQERQKLIAQLKKEGVLDQNKKFEIPLVPLNIGLITSDDSAAYNDFIKELECSAYGFKIFMRNALMQGKNAEKDVCNAIRDCQKIKGLDVIVITRGGGSIADLSCFDSRKIAEAIGASEVSVLSGIGHEINTTVTDLAAHSYEKTPTAIAQFLVERIKSFNDSLDRAMDIVTDYADEKVKSESSKLRNLAHGLQDMTHRFLKFHNEHLVRAQELIKTKPMYILKDLQSSLKNRNEHFLMVAKNRMLSEKNRIDAFEKVVDILHPTNTMKRGFSITRSLSGKAIKSIKDVKKNELIETDLTDGKLQSQVQ